MAKKITLLCCALALVLSLLSGCQFMTNGEYISVTNHENSENGEDPRGTVVSASNYEELTEAMLSFVSNHDSYGIIRAVGYDGDIEAEASEACMDVSYNTPMGAYSVYYMSCSVSKIVSYYEVELSITYKRTAEEIDAVEKLTSRYGIQSKMAVALDGYNRTVAFYTNSTEMTDEFFQNIMEELYYEKGASPVAIPDVTVTFYPEEHLPAELCIIEVGFDYMFSPSTMLNVEKRLIQNVRQLAGEAAGLNDQDALFLMCTRLAAIAEYVPDPENDELYDRADTRYTAYGALVGGKAASEGLAMGYKLLCDELGIEALVVTGRYNGNKHAWNIVNLDGTYYHVDVSRCFAEGVAEIFLKSDSEMPSAYTWDREDYVECPTSYPEMLGRPLVVNP